jgi:hypothetical protein
VTEVLNKVLPTVVIPPDGVSPLALQQQEQKKAEAASGQAPVGASTPAAPPPALGDQPAAQPAN